MIITTELITGAALALLSSLPILVVPLLALTFGFVLNGTSSVLYATVAELVDERRRSRGYGLYDTLANGASALAPVLYGLPGDRAGLPVILVALAATNLLTVPVAVAVRMKDAG